MIKWDGKLVEIYDLWWSDRTEEEVSFWQKTCLDYVTSFCSPDRPLRIVELCSGTGRILLPVVERVKTVHPQVRGIGLDFSPAMNSLLTEKAKAKNLGNEVSAVNFDLSISDWTPALQGKSVDIFLLPFNHFELVGDVEIQKTMVRNIGKFLSTGGLFVACNYNPLTRKEENNGRKELRRVVADEINKRVLFYWRMSTPLDDECRSAEVTYGIECVEWMNDGLHIQSLPATMRIRYLMPDELDTLFRENGLSVLAEYGNFDFRPYLHNSRRKIIVAKKL